MFKLQFPIVLIALSLFHGVFSAPQGLISSSIQGLCPGSGDSSGAYYDKQAQNLANYVASVGAGTTAGVLNGNAVNTAAAIQAIAQAFGQGLSNREVDEMSDENLAMRLYARVAQNLEKFNDRVNAGVSNLSTGISNDVLNRDPVTTAAAIQGIAQAFGQALSPREVDEISDQDLLADVNELLARQNSCQRI